MTKQITITLSDHVYRMYIQPIRFNRSRAVEEMILISQSVEQLGYNELTIKQTELIQQNKNLNSELYESRHEISQLKKELGRYKELFRNPEQKAKRKLEEQKALEKLKQSETHKKVQDYDFSTFSKEKIKNLDKTLLILRRDPFVLDGRCKAWNNLFTDQLSESEFQFLIDKYKKYLEVQNVDE